MGNFKGTYKKKSYFEGWYFKNQNDNEIISFIPASHIDENGKKSASLQIIMNNTSDYITYPIDDFAVSTNKFAIKIGENIFTEKGILLNIEIEQTTKGCIGIVYYRGKEYRFTTYLGVKIKKYSKDELWVQQRDYDLQVTIIDENPHNLLAPIKGKMARTVYESINCRVRYRFMVDNNVLFDFIARGSFERGFLNCSIS